MSPERSVTDVSGTVDFFDADGLSGKKYAEVDLLVVQAKTSAAGDLDGAVVEGIVRFWDAAIGAAGSGIDLGGIFHPESFMRAFQIEFLQEGVELGLLLQDVGARWTVASFFKVRCMRSWRPFCWGWLGRIRSMEIPKRSYHTESLES